MTVFFEKRKQKQQLFRKVCRRFVSIFKKIFKRGLILLLYFHHFVRN